MGKGKITRQEHPADQRRVDELDEAYAPRSKRRFASTPGIKQVRNTELVVIDDGTTRQLAVRIDGTLYAVTLTAL
jgi:hypothetical protein